MVLFYFLNEIINLRCLDDQYWTGFYCCMKDKFKFLFKYDKYKLIFKFGRKVITKRVL